MPAEMSAEMSAADRELLRLLAAWLPAQRWFPGRGANLAGITVVSDVSLQPGEPALRHLIVEAELRSGPARFQVLVGYRRELPGSLDAALIGYVDDAACYDALHDPELADVLLSGITAQRLADNVRFVHEAGAPPLTAVEPSTAAEADGSAPALRSRVLSAEQSNTSLVFGDRAILKMVRRLFPGANPDLEVADALARLGSARVAAPYGWIETDLDGEPVLLGVLSQFLAGASDGWTLALASLHRLYARHEAYGQEYLTERVRSSDDRNGAAAPPAAAGLPFTDEARLLGQATAELHADLAEAFGSEDMSRTELTGLTAGMHDKLTEAIAVVPVLAEYEQRIRSAYDAAAELERPVAVQRIHGDYHLGQVLRAGQGWVALDFEGEPAVPLAIRRAPAPALRDVAGMLRSFDYAARHQLIGQPGAEPVAEPVAAVADQWVRQCQAAFCAGYAAGGGRDPDGHGTLLRALTLEKAVYEVVYEYRHRPSWLSIPLDYVATA
jgi:maltokinase